jgi:hypothetical protein
MSVYFIVYHSLVAATILLSISAYNKKTKRLNGLIFLLSLTLLVELAAEILSNNKIEFVWIYHIFNILEYCLLAIFLGDMVVTRKIRHFINVSVIIYILLGTAISFFFYAYTGFPSININIEGFLLSLISIYALFNLDPKSSKSIFTHPDFWFCSGILIFFGCTAFMNGLYTNILNYSKSEAIDLFSVINKPLNIILYSFFGIGILCIILTKRDFQ